VSNAAIPRRRHLARAIALTLALLTVLPCPAQSLRIDYEVGASYTHSDNISLSETAPDSDAVLSPELRFNATQSGSRVELRARGILQYLAYRDGTYDDEFAGEFAGQLNWVLLPDRISFVVEDYLTRQAVNPAGGFTPDNQEQINVFLAGPSFFARFGSAMRGQADLRYSDTYAEENQSFNGNRYNAALRLFRELGALDWVSLNAEATKAEFDIDTGAPDYRRYDAYFGYRRELQKYTLETALGYSRLETDGDDGHASSPLARLSLTWNLAPRSTLSASASYAFGDTASDLIALGERPQIPIGAGTDNVAAGPDVFRERRLEVGYRFEGERLGFEVRPYYERFDYVSGLSQDVEARGASAGIDYRLTPRTTLSLTGAHQSRELFDGSQDDDDSMLRLGLEREFTRHWRALVAVQRRERDSSIAGQSYEEDLAMLSVTWRR
jgi:hypothetical protein